MVVMAGRRSGHLHIGAEPCWGLIFLTCFTFVVGIGKERHMEKSALDPAGLKLLSQKSSTLILDHQALEIN